jgi:acetyltransferase-like isoleucine patch superfamily enzyme
MARLADDWFPRELPMGLTLGERSFLYSAYAFLHCDPAMEAAVRIGDDTGVYHGTFFELGREARVEVGKFCALVGAILRAEREIRIGDYVFIAHEVVISDCDGVGSERWAGRGGFTVPASCEAKPVRIGDDVWIGMRATILSGVTIGDGAVIGAGAVVCEDVPPYTVATGNPARVVRTLSPRQGV